MWRIRVGTHECKKPQWMSIECMTACLCNFLEVTVGLWLYENDTVKQLFNNGVLVLVVGIRDLL
jgi:hypothetical protein